MMAGGIVNQTLQSRVLSQRAGLMAKAVDEVLEEK